MAQRVHLTDQQRNDLRHWIEVDLMTQQKAADQLGVGQWIVADACRKMGLKTQRTGPRGGAGHPQWKGGRSLDKSGYVLIYMPDHPDARRKGAGRKSGGYVREHRLVMERLLGRMLQPHEVVDHINGQKDDNRPENLRLFQTNADHLRVTLAGKCPKWTAEGVERIASSKGWTQESIDRLKQAGDGVANTPA